MSVSRRYLFTEPFFLVSFILMVPMLVFFILSRNVQLHDMLARSPWSSDVAVARGYDPVRHSASEYLFGGGELSLAIFSAREIAHMRDVRQLFMLQAALIAITAAACIGLGIHLYVRGAALTVLVRRGAVWGSSSLIVFGVAMALFFDQIFIAFHRVLFANDYWLLDPDRHILIRAYPPDFFRQFSLLVFFVVIAVHASIWAALAVSKKR